MNRLKTLFVAGTGTEVGKTYISAKLAREACARGTKVGVYKPVASGCIRATESKHPELEIESDSLISEDAIDLWVAAGKPLTLNAVCPQRFEAAVAPNEAAKSEGRTVKIEMLVGGSWAWNGECDLLIIEGAGGLFSPIADGILNSDLAKEFPDAEVVLVAANRLGVIHSVIATCRAAEKSGIALSRLYLSQGRRKSRRVLSRKRRSDSSLLSRP